VASLTTGGYSDSHSRRLVGELVVVAQLVALLVEPFTVLLVDTPEGKHLSVWSWAVKRFAGAFLMESPVEVFRTTMN
jgi:hypothetical protein